MRVCAVGFRALYTVASQTARFSTMSCIDEQDSIGAAGKFGNFGCELVLSDDSDILPREFLGKLCRHVPPKSVIGAKGIAKTNDKNLCHACRSNRHS